VRWCVFCGSSPGGDPRFVAAARELGGALARRGIEIVYGGGRIGLMGAVADAALEAGGRVTGIIPHALERREVAHQGITDLRVVASMHERKALMAELSDGFIALPGGFGTLEEFSEAITWVQLGLQQKPCLLVNIAGYYDPLIAMFDRAHELGFVNAVNRAIPEVFPTVAALLARIALPA
jgi:uncharacterized protein (TIGR00730 family)